MTGVVAENIPSSLIIPLLVCAYRWVQYVSVACRQWTCFKGFKNSMSGYVSWIMMQPQSGICSQNLIIQYVRDSQPPEWTSSWGSREIIARVIKGRLQMILSIMHSRKTKANVIYIFELRYWYTDLHLYEILQSVWNSHKYSYSTMHSNSRCRTLWKVKL